MLKEIEVVGNVVFHKYGYFQITQKELEECTNKFGKVNKKKIQKLYHNKYSCKNWAA